MSAVLDSDLLRTFVAVVDTGNFTRAGEIVGRTQSAVSLQVRRLEDVVGASLFQRGPRGVEPTDKAALLLPNARRILALMEDTVGLVSARPLDGPVRIGVPEEYCQSILPHALGAFAKRHPMVEVTVLYGSSVANRAAAEAGRLDLAVVFEPEGVAMADRLTVDPTVWVTSEIHAVHEQEPVPVALAYGATWCRDAALAALARDGIRYRVAFSGDTAASLQAAVTSGLAVAPLSRSNLIPLCRELGPEDGFGIVDASQVGVVQSPGAASPAVAGMRRALRDAFGSRFGS